jgi:hypothetical protein
MNSKLITSEEQLRTILPNIFATVKGETSLFDKLTPFLESAEQWVKNTFTAESPYNTIAGYADTNTTKTLTARIVIAEAYRSAIPSLDLVLTPNGFGVVSNSNVAPASKQRVDRLIDAMVEQRDGDIELLIPLLPSVSKWKTSEQYSWFAATLFPNIDVVKTLTDTPTNRWNKFLELRPQIIDIESSLAEDFFSHELMTALRQRAAANELSTTDLRIVNIIRSQVISVLKGTPINMRQMIDLVNHIRSNASAYPEWHTSATSKLFSPPIFTNQKTSSGYFF